MANVAARSGMQNQLGAILQFGVVGDLSDSQLLQRFLSGRDGAEQAAFSALMERPWSDGAQRLPAGSRQFARRPGRISGHVSGRWPERPARCTTPTHWPVGSTGLRSGSPHGPRQTRPGGRLHERRFATMKVNERDKATVGPEPCPELHEEIARLPRRFREPVVLCYLEGLSSEQAAMRIGCAPGTVWSRLSRARERLRSSLVRRRVALPRRDARRRVHNACIDRPARNIGRGDGHGRRGVSPHDKRPKPHWPQHRRSRSPKACFMP